MIYSFAEYELDTKGFELRRNGEPVPVEPQVFDVLAYLAANPDRLIEREEFLDQVWKDRYVSDSALSARIMAARRAVGDTGTAQRLIKTVHGRGFRFVGQVQKREASSGSIERTVEALLELPGREDELQTLKAAFANTKWSKQVILIEGPAGIGKSALISAFLATLRGSSIAFGSCTEVSRFDVHVPVLEVVSALASNSNAAREVIVRCAPSWAIQIPSLVAGEDLGRLRELSLNTSEARMHREFIEVVSFLAADDPLVIAVEDIHWADPATAGLIRKLALQPLSCRILLLLTARSDEEAFHGDLHGRTDVTRVLLKPLDVGAVSRMLSERFGAEPNAEVTKLVTSRTIGHPLYSLLLAEDWLRSGLLHIEGGAILPSRDAEHLRGRIPETLGGLLRNATSSLNEAERECVEVASCIGRSFAPETVSAALAAPLPQVETSLQTLALHGKVIRRNDSGNYSFTHDLYRESLYEDLSVSRRQLLHAALVAALEQAPEANVHELARHALAAGDMERAPAFLIRSAEKLVEKSAYSQALDALEKAQVLRPLSSQEELQLRLVHARARVFLHGWTDSLAEQSYCRALELADELGDQSSVFTARYSLGALFEISGRYTQAEEIMQGDLDDLEVTRRIDACELLACSSFHQAKYDRCIEIALLGSELSLGPIGSDVDPAYGENPRVACDQWGSFALFFRGREEEALQRSERAVQIAEEARLEYSLATALSQLASLHQLRGNAEETLRWAEATLRQSSRLHYTAREGAGLVFCGWAKANLGQVEAGLEDLQAGIEKSRSIGYVMDVPYYLGLLAEARLLASGLSQAQADIEQALESAPSSRGFFYYPELLRIAGLIQRKQGNETAARELFAASLQLAMEQGSLPLIDRARRELEANPQTVN